MDDYSSGPQQWPAAEILDAFQGLGDVFHQRAAKQRMDVASKKDVVPCRLQ